MTLNITLPDEQEATLKARAEAVSPEQCEGHLLTQALASSARQPLAARIREIWSDMPDDVARSCPKMEPASTIITSMVFARERSEGSFCRRILLDSVDGSGGPAFPRRTFRTDGMRFQKAVELLAGFNAEKLLQLGRCYPVVRVFFA